MALSSGLCAGRNLVAVSCWPMADQIVPVLRVADAHRAAQWYQTRLGFEMEFESRYSSDFPAYMEIRRGDLAIHLSELPGDATPDTLVFVYVDDLETLAEDQGLEVLETTWSREVRLADPDGNRVRLGQRKYLAETGSDDTSSADDDGGRDDAEDPDEAPGGDTSDGES